MAERVKYFLLGLLFVIVAGVITYDQWIYRDTADRPVEQDTGDRFSMTVGRDEPPPVTTRGRRDTDREPVIEKQPLDVKRKPKPRPIVRPPIKPKPPDAKPAREQLHVVRAGETLGEIAQHYYKTNNGIIWIVDANGLANPNRIFEKQELVIPPPPGSAKRVATRTTKPTKIPLRYTVKAGEDLYTVCRRFYGTKGEGARVNKIMELNGLWTVKVQKGTVILLREEK